jgi:hypothetical protein
VQIAEKINNFASYKKNEYLIVSATDIFGITWKISVYPMGDNTDVGSFLMYRSAKILPNLNIKGSCEFRIHHPSMPSSTLITTLSSTSNDDFLKSRGFAVSFFSYFFFFLSTFFFKFVNIEIDVIDVHI